MKTLAGRHIYIVDLKKVLGADTPTVFAQKCRKMQLNGVWIRTGHGSGKDPNMTLASLDAVRDALQLTGVELWGWHVPYCSDQNAAKAEAAGTLKMAGDARLDGIVVDAERTNDPPRFVGGADEAETYLQALSTGLTQTNKGFAFSSHDQPALHHDLPFAVFLKYISDICPQVYYRETDPSIRLNKSVHDYKQLVPASEFAARYKPTGNITLGGVGGFSNATNCVTATHAFLKLVKTSGYAAHSFWCWDNAAKDVLAALEQDPPTAIV